MSEPLSWFVVEPGWKVVGRGGETLGRVDELVGDTGKDIFSGLKIASGVLGRPRFVPAERVRSISDGRVEVDLSKRELRKYKEPPPHEEIRPT